MFACEPWPPFSYERTWPFTSSSGFMSRNDGAFGHQAGLKSEYPTAVKSFNNTYSCLYYISDVSAMFYTFSHSFRKLPVATSAKYCEKWNDMLTGFATRSNCSSRGATWNHFVSDILQVYTVDIYRQECSSNDSWDHSTSSDMFWFVDCEFGNQHEVPVTHYWGTFIWSGEGFDDADIWWPHCRRRLCLRLQSLQANVTPLQSVMSHEQMIWSLISSCPSKPIQLSIHCAVHWLKKNDVLENAKLTWSDSNFSKTFVYPGMDMTDRNLFRSY